MKQFCVVVMAGLSFALPAAAQQAPQQPTTVAAFVRARYTARKSVYGSMVTTMRIKSIVPASSEPRSPQPQQPPR